MHLIFKSILISAIWVLSTAKQQSRYFEQILTFGFTISPQNLIDNDRKRLLMVFATMCLDLKKNLTGKKFCEIEEIIYVKSYYKKIVQLSVETMQNNKIKFCRK